MPLETQIENREMQGNIAHRFRGYYPVVVDVETGGFNAVTDALLEIAAVTLSTDEKGQWLLDQSMIRHVNPFPK